MKRLSSLAVRPHSEVINDCECGILSLIMQVKLCHPDSDDLAFLYGTIVTDGEDEWSDKPTAHILCFGSNGQVCILAKITLKLFVFDKKFKSRFFLQFSEDRNCILKWRLFAIFTFSCIIGKLTSLKTNIKAYASHYTVLD